MSGKSGIRNPSVKESEGVFRTIFEQAAVGIAQIASKTGAFVRVNRRYAKIVGYTVAEMERLTFQQITHPDDLRQGLANMQSLLTGEIREFSTEKRHYHKDGSIVWVNLTVSPMGAASDEPEFHIAVVEEITERKLAQETARQAGARSRAILEALPDLMFQLTRDGVHVDFHASSQDRLFAPVESILGHRLDELLPEDVAGEYLLHIAQCLDNNRMEVFEYHLAFSEADERDYEARMVPQGEDSVLTIVRDITDRKQTERALRVSEENFRQIAETIHEVFWIGSPDWKKVFYVSPAYEDIWGRSRQSLYDDPFSWLDGVHADDRDMILDAMERKLRGEDSAPEFPEHRLLRPDGSVRWIATRAFPIRDDHGQVIRIVGIAEDVTEYRRAQQDYQTLFREMLDGFALHEIICDDRGRPVDYRFLAVNPAFERLTGLKAENLIGRTVREVIPHIEDFWVETYGRVALTGEPARFENYSQELDKHYTVTAFQPTPGQFACIFSDVTDRRQAEKEREELIARLEAQNAELERFTYTVSHDLKSPLITIKGYIGALAEDLTEAGVDFAKDDLTRIANAADKMGDLLGDLLELSRVGRLANPPENVCLEELGREALELVHGQLQEKKVQVTFLPGLPVVYGDRIRLREVLQNLIDNAVKYMGDQSRPQIEIGTRRDGDETICYIRDNGIGIDSRFHEKIFGLFNQLDPQVAGTGIGLALARRIIDVHGGRIWVESEGSGCGSTFCFTLPVAD